jgi:dTDP-4-amino-4,6-dideoxygalactose transaminase
VSNWNIPLSDIDFDGLETEAVLEVLKDKWLSMGPKVEAFEAAFRAMSESPHALAVSIGTAALHLALLGLGIGPGDEVIQPALNFVASANVTVAAGATPVFADIVSDVEPVIDPRAVEALCTPKTRAMICMHYGGFPAPMAALREIFNRRGIHLIEDACHAVGGSYMAPAGPENTALTRRPVGSAADVACYSFFSNKNLAVGEGGMVTTTHDEVAKRIRQLRSHGMTTLTWDRHRGHANTYDVIQHGYNYRLDEIRAALGTIQLQKLAANNRHRLHKFSQYVTRLAALKEWRIPFAHVVSSPDSATGTAHLVVLLAPTSEKRDRLRDHLKALKIQTSLHYPTITTFSAFSAYAGSAVPKSLDYSSRALTLPLYPTLSEDGIDEVCRHICAFAQNESRV